MYFLQPQFAAQVLKRAVSSLPEYRSYSHRVVGATKYIYIPGQWSTLAWVQGSPGYITTWTRVFQMSLHTHIFQDVPQRRKDICANARLHTACSPMKYHSQWASIALGMPATPSPEQPSFSQCTWPWKLIRITPINIPSLHALGNITELFSNERK